MEYFDPVAYSVEELNFLKENLGKPAIVALSEIKQERLQEPARDKNGRVKDKNPVYYPNGVNPAAVKPILTKVNEYQELEKHQGVFWCGVDALKAAIQVFLDENEKWERNSKRGAPRWPSLYSFDMKGKGHLSGPGSDSGLVQTYFGPDGKRKPFKIPFVPQDLTEWSPFEVAKEAAPATDTRKIGILNDPEKGRIECLICNHTENYNKESRPSYNAARARMSKHLRSAKDERDAHAEAHTNEFRS